MKFIYARSSQFPTAPSVMARAVGGDSACAADDIVEADVPGATAMVKLPDTFQNRKAAAGGLYRPGDDPPDYQPAAGCDECSPLHGFWEHLSPEQTSDGHAVWLWHGSYNDVE